MEIYKNILQILKRREKACNTYKIIMDGSLEVITLYSFSRKYHHFHYALILFNDLFNAREDKNKYSLNMEN